MGGQEEAVLCGIGDLRVDDGARDHVAVPVPVAGLGREHPRLVPLLGDDERDSCIWSLHSQDLIQSTRKMFVRGCEKFLPALA